MDTKVQNPALVSCQGLRNEKIMNLTARCFTLKTLVCHGLAVILLITVSAVSFAANKAPIMLEKQGNFSAGGTVIYTEGKFDGKQLFNSQGQTLHGDHASVFYQIPVDAKPYPLVFLHGAGQSASTWGTTPDGREGFQSLFLRKKYPVYLVDQPRRGRAGQSTVSMEVEATTYDQMWFNMFRIGQWPERFKGVQFPDKPEALNQYFRQMTPNTGPYDEQLISDSLAQVFKRSGDSVLITHSQGGGPGWWTAIKSDKVRGIVSYEPGSGFVFPEGEVPDAMESGTGKLTATPVSIEQFKKLTQIPIIIYYGDNIPSKKSDNPGQDNWRVRVSMAHLWVNKINQYGGQAQVVELPKIGVYGNTHFPFSDLNNEKIATLLEQWLEKNKLSAQE
ncbi:alpha/beta fold hydrolase [Psychrobacter sp. APC 3281]|uniref:alpha/beta hydrolase n=1 Tax=unclassified Psychrobacter TaxID=196806 RepID=UPI001E65D22B|nr:MULTISPECIES: alpha/beta fold hydrolase [unclassified Psychrobacter]MDN3446763.1 alpha/beta fold hydrolase [Psychrobacter sp. APC 3281]